MCAVFFLLVKWKIMRVIRTYVYTNIKNGKKKKLFNKSRIKRVIVGRWFEKV